MAQSDKQAKMDEAQVPGGAYIVGGRLVDANGDVIDTHTIDESTGLVVPIAAVKAAPVKQDEK